MESKTSLIFYLQKFINVGSDSPKWSKGLKYTYEVDVGGLEWYKISSDFVESLLIKLAEENSTDRHKYVYVSHTFSVHNRNHNDTRIKEYVRRVLAAQISKQDD